MDLVAPLRDLVVISKGGMGGATRWHVCRWLSCTDLVLGGWSALEIGDLLVLICALLLQRRTPEASTTQSLRSRLAHGAILVLSRLSNFCDLILIEHWMLPPQKILDSLHV
jgi:hypothetical protein